MNYSTSGKSLHSKLLRMKFISCILAPTIASTSFCATNSASEPTKPQDSKVHNSQKSSSTLKTIAKEAAICSGAVLLIVGSALCGKKYFSAETPQENPTPSTQGGSSAPSAQESSSAASKQENLTETRILHYPSEPLSTDVWFTQLGGNSNDIAEYLGMNVPIVDGIEDLRMNSYTYDGKGVYCRENLGEIVVINAKRNQSLKDLFYRIFAIHNYKTKKTYTRFYSPYFEIVLSKFLTDGNTTLESLSPETEAKIFYILSKILTTTSTVIDKYRNIDFEKIPNISALTKNPIYQTCLKSIQEPSIAWENIWLSSGRNCLSCPQFLKVWDMAIMNISNPANSSNELRQNLDAILSRLFLKYASESGITNGRELSDAIKNGGMSRFYENFDNFRAALQDIIE